MGKREFTKEQLSAIETRDKTLLVSAAAGSGKTATLTERIIRSITDEKNPEDISRMLIVTFTNAAVDELRGRITAALKEKLAENPENKRLEHQLYMLPSARISTIDSFCNDILKNNTERFGISPRYRIADPIEADILAHSVWSSLIDAAYDGELIDVGGAEEFEELANCLTGVKSSSALEEVFKLLYDKSKSHESGARVFKEFKDKLLECESLPIEENPYVKYAINRAKEAASHYMSVIKWLMHGFLGNDKYIGVMNDDIAALENIISADSYERMRTAINHKFSSMPSIRGEKTEDELSFAALRTDMKTALGERCAERYFTYVENEWHSHVSDLARLLGTLSAFIEKFDSVYFEEKRSRAMLEYSDIERLTYLALYENDGTPSDLALALREEFTSVYIDEYQDVNSLQNKIFLAISRPNNRFTVGDIKQSIYGFRNACPDIFADMKGQYPPLENSDDSDCASIFMSKNFRCDRGIIDFVNGIFDDMFALCAESIGYVSEDRLVCAKIYDSTEPPYRTPEIQLFAKGSTASDSDEDAPSSKELAPEWVAEKIKELLSGEKLNSGKPIAPSDIAIILRKDQGRSRAYTEALLKAGIKAKAPENKDFFLNSEIQLVLCLLNSINNPMRDIYLAGLMLSPLFSFTPDELYLARRLGGASLWHSVKRYSESRPEDSKFANFISTLNHYRTISEGVQVDALILRLYNETGILALAAKAGCKENLMLLYNYARKFEASSFEGLYNFINYVNTVIESGAAFSSKKEGEDTDAVTVMTVHKSKGLEFPVVFLADASAPLVSRNEKNPRVAYSDELGIGLKTRRHGGIALVESPVYNVIVDSNVEKSLEEELRVYYVALTRARERLFIVASPSTPSKEEYLASAKLRKIRKSSYSLKQMKTFVDILYLTDTNARITWQENETQDLSDTDTDGFISEYDIDSDFDDPYSDLNLHFDTEEERREFFEEFEYALRESEYYENDEIGGITNRQRFFEILNKKYERYKKSRLNAPPQESKTENPKNQEPKYDENLYNALTERFAYKYPNLLFSELPEKMSISKLYPTVLDGGDEELRLTIDTDAPIIKKKLGRLPEFVTGSSEYESAKRGIATHNFLQFFDIERFLSLGAKEELEQLVKTSFISTENAKKVRLDEIELFLKSDLLSQMKKAKHLYRELRFSVMLPASLFTENEAKRIAYANSKILMQGVIDCIIEDSEGRLHLIDYKTDRLTHAELSDKALAQKVLSEKHSLQLHYYALAVEKIFGKRPYSTRVYSLPLGDTVDV